MTTENKYKDLVHELSEFCKKHKLPSGQVGYLTGLFVKHEQQVKKCDLADVGGSLICDDCGEVKKNHTMLICRCDCNQ